ncbi:leucine rich repeat containing 58 [Columba livia]|uniref:Leucine rich repeat containing 58 n=1 Tax=Columba livia TaxID=8932 RepID=A0A2I0MLF7_COLLI|nr:leucine rich repeat containing 58 [Columba livia]
MALWGPGGRRGIFRFRGGEEEAGRGVGAPGGTQGDGLGPAPLGRSLRVLNLSGNRFAEVPPALLELHGLQSLQPPPQHPARDPGAPQFRVSVPWREFHYFNST